VKRCQALFRDTWWLWLAFAVVGGGLALFSPIFWLTFPVCAVTFVRFAFVQYDEDGNFVSN